MRRMLLVMLTVLVGDCINVNPTMANEPTIVHTSNAVDNVILAAREVRRYVYLRTRELLPIATHVPIAGEVIHISIDKTLGTQMHQLKSVTQDGRTILYITGGSDIASLYGAYRYAETLGVRFYVHGDVIPDERIAFVLPKIDEIHKPLFEHRGIQPFHDFTEGPDWWSLDDYKTYISQLAKMRMNWIGFHCYPEPRVGPEPLVWIGLPEDVNEDGTVKFSYPSHWASTVGGTFGYGSTKTSEFAAGAGLLFAEDYFGPSVMEGNRSQPDTGEEHNNISPRWSLTMESGKITLPINNDIFNNTGRFLHAAFTHARSLGIKTVIGTETPLLIPTELKAHLKAKGMDPNDPTTVLKLYEGMFKRITKTHPLDYYWLWTPEGWTWSGTKQAQVNATMHDIKTALNVLASQGKPFGFATSGWVLGPEQDRTLFDKSLPKDAAIACINRQVGLAPVEPGFAGIEGRPQWAIPWVEDDPAMVIPQLWAGRMRRDAADAHAYGCTGLMGIHWRTKVLAPNFSALAQAGWDQTGWNKDFGQKIMPSTDKNVDVHAGGQIASFTAAILDTHEDPIYQTVRFNLNAYQIKVPNGQYTVTLKFCEPHYSEPGRRVFGVKLQGDQIIDKLDVFAKVGKNRALDRKFQKIEVTGEVLTIEFIKQIEFPCIAGIEINGMTAASNQIVSETFTRKINCGGGVYKDYAADLPAKGGGNVEFLNKPRDLPIDDFYRDWCRAWFGPEAVKPLAALFTRIDGGGPPNISQSTRGANLPRPSTWISGPGGIVVNDTPWEQEKVRYAFVDEMAKLRDKVQGAGNLARFDYWLNTMRYLRAIGHLGCARGELDQAMAQVQAQKDPVQKKQIADQALAIRSKLARLWETMMTLQLAVTDTVGEMGTIANLEQHVLRNPREDSKHRFIDIHDTVLAHALGGQLPDQVHPTTRYLGKSRLIVPTVRTSISQGERLTLKVIVLDNDQPQAAKLLWRPLGHGTWKTIPLTHVGRGVHTVTLPPAPGLGLEYYVQVKTAAGREMLWPATAPAINQTVVVIP